MTREDALTKWLPIVKMGVENMPELKDAVNIAISDVEKIKRINEIMSHEWSCWTPNYIQRVLDGTEDRY